MASAASIRKWLFRDLWRVSALIALFIIIVPLLISYFVWSPPQIASAARSTKNHNANKRIYDGLIFIPTERPNICWELIFDNRTGEMRDNGYAKCESVAAINETDSFERTRLREVGKAFRH